jgi:hypothetical protein
LKGIFFILLTNEAVLHPGRDEHGRGPGPRAYRGPGAGQKITFSEQKYRRREENSRLVWNVLEGHCRRFKNIREGSGTIQNLRECYRDFENLLEVSTRFHEHPCPI